MRVHEERVWQQGAEGRGQIVGAHEGRSSRGASSVDEQAPSSCGSAVQRPKERVLGDPAERDYVRAILDCYLWLPGTGTVISRHDRRCVRGLFRRGVPLGVVKSAMVVAVARRTFRSGGPLPRVRAMHYFLPVIEELLEWPCDSEYIHYLEHKLRSLAAKVGNGGQRRAVPSS
jgi:hypothetical protein